MIGVSCSSVGLGLLIILVVLCTVSGAARYRAKYTLYIFCSFLFATAPIPLMLLRPRDWRNALIPAWLITRFSRMIGCHFILIGKENIVKDTGAVVLINHQSCLDVIVLGELWPVLERCTVIAKNAVLYLGSYGLASWLWGTIFIDRKNSNAQNKVNSTIEIIKKRRARVLFFPEGTRHSNNTLKSFKKGAFHVAIDSQIPIQPVVVSKYYYINHKLKRFDSGVNYISILPPISTEGKTKKDIPSLMEQSYQCMNEEFKKNTQEAIENFMADKKQ
ncbi:1-acyl-sn-glycerol-3-phosphate acyltransferase beta [Cotesia glomerata]|uniref:1-acyl-sn-glycerol-3-phosphate acyltransferase beta n=1 Tax=Cotesia glomerata TaxID=32391 RepID=UPI001D02BA20|nr:1-acyl-sn-glycerol-3-phosphate acyltransferase beta [Cotesia glomerata]XP_044595719.1 1-acyl-sn-glycerol-3-phosphate acyltransferase beta [Cotesia glomerata]